MYSLLRSISYDKEILDSESDFSFQYSSYVEIEHGCQNAKNNKGAQETIRRKDSSFVLVHDLPYWKK